MKNEVLVIFDFDGTVVDSKNLTFNVLNKRLSKYGFSEKQIKEAIAIGLTLSNTLREMGLSKLLSFFVRRKIKKDVIKEYHKIKKCHDVEYIKKCKGKKIMISNSLKEFILPVLKHLKIKRYFEEIYGGESFNEKGDFIRKYLKKHKVNPKNCYYVGDRVVDVKVAEESECKSIIVSGKYAWDSRDKLLKAKPDYIVDDLKDVNEIVNNLDNIV